MEYLCQQVEREIAYYECTDCSAEDSISELFDQVKCEYRSKLEASLQAQLARCSPHKTPGDSMN